MAIENGNRLDALLAARRATEALCAPLRTEDHVVQPREAVSPPKWHLAHTTWFFETFLLGRYQPGYHPAAAEYAFLFNSYYESVGSRAEKGERGSYSRPTVREVLAYRRRVDESLGDLLASPLARNPDVEGLVELGIHHEQQHQELLVTDIKAILHFNPSRPAYLEGSTEFHPRPAKPESNPASAIGLSSPPAPKPRWIAFPSGLREIGWHGGGFSFDNERPRHPVFVAGFRLEDRLVTNAGYLEFIRAEGYSRPEFWLSEGWRLARQEGWKAPLYWEEIDGRWSEYTLGGTRPLDPDSPVCHVSHFEADAFARWRRARLPTEAEWETACIAGDAGLLQMTGELWQWTASAYLPYPGFRPFPGAVGEYNGKFMMDQMVLRGGSCATPAGHLRPTYRNFFPAATRWQFSGIRLAEDG
ncbi:MAG: ergothioneine biosynthesis protein EgtB [Fibrobacteres bacterium]|nr:ergothioneine biosynthesis protein EgtB [Fibrobacterota bacterium]